MPSGQVHRLALFTDKDASRAMGDRIDNLNVLKVSGQTPGVEMQRWIENLPLRIKKQLANWGVLDQSRIAASDVLTDQVKDWEEALKAEDTKRKYRKQAVARVRRVIHDCGFQFWTDVSARAFHLWVNARMSEGMAKETINAYLRSLKAFCNWAIRAERIFGNPVAHLRCLNSDTDQRLVRRALTIEERIALLNAAKNAEPFHGMTGYERFIIYRLALETGLRWDELRTLLCSAFGFKGKIPTVTVIASRAKNKRETALPLRPKTAALIQKHIDGRLSNEEVFPNSWKRRSAEMLRHDLKVAEIKEETVDGVIDFHALRTSFLSALPEAGVHPATAQKLARHSRMDLTLKYYTRVPMDVLADAVSRLPDIDNPKKRRRKSRKKKQSRRKKRPEDDKTPLA